MYLSSKKTLFHGNASRCRRYQALVLAADSQKGGTDGATFAAQAEEFYAAHLPKVRKLDSAFKGLHEDIDSMQKLLAEFCSKQSSPGASQV